MRTRTLLTVLTAGLVVLIHIGADALRAQAPGPAVLTGTVSSVEEGNMEGVLVTLRRTDAPFTVTVVSDGQGRYSFPKSHLEPGQYSVRIRAIGYDLETQGPVTITSNSPATVDLRLRKTKDLAAQLTTLDWNTSVPGTPEQKRGLVRCGFCHTFERVARSKYTADEWLPVIQRMSTYYSDGTNHRRFQRRQVGPPPAPAAPTAAQKAQAQYLATINLSQSDTWSYPLKTFPRPTGRATRVIVTEYDFPRPTTVIHDLDVDSQGNVWYGDAGWLFLGRLDTKTATFTEYPIPGFMPKNPIGVLDVHFDKQDNLWVAMMMQGSKVMKFDTKTLEPTFWDIPEPEDGRYRRVAFLMPFYSDVDGKVWATDAGQYVFRLDAGTGKMEVFSVFDDVPGEGHRIYQVTADAQNNGYFLDAGAANIGRVDAQTGEVTLYPVPTPNSFPRRGIFDAQNRLWFGEFNADRIGMFDPRTERIREWVVPTPYWSPYFASGDMNGDVWVSGNQADRVMRLDPESGDIINYLMPGYTDTRKIAFDRSTDRVRFWLPNKGNATLIRVEPLD